MKKAEQQPAEYRRWWAPDFALGASHARNVVSDVASLPHTHGEYALVTCLSGSMEFICDGEWHKLEPGEMLVHNPGQIHESGYGGGGIPCDGFTIYFDRWALEKSSGEFACRAIPNRTTSRFSAKTTTAKRCLSDRN